MEYRERREENVAHEGLGRARGEDLGKSQVLEAERARGEGEW